MLKRIYKKYVFYFLNIFLYLLYILIFLHIFCIFFLTYLYTIFIYHKNKKFIQYIQPRNKYKKLEHTQKFTSRFKKKFVPILK